MLNGFAVPFAAYKTEAQVDIAQLKMTESK